MENRPNTRNRYAESELTMVIIRMEIEPITEKGYNGIVGYLGTVTVNGHAAGMNVSGSPEKTITVLAKLASKHPDMEV